MAEFLVCTLYPRLFKNTTEAICRKMSFVLIADDKGSYLQTGKIRDFRIPPRFKRDLGCSGMLRGFYW